MNEKKLSIVLPIYNEEKSIKKTILETFWLKIILAIFDTAIKALKEKNKLIK